MKVRLVCYENVGDWIVGKFAAKLNEGLLALGVRSDIGQAADSDADVNHHLLYLGYENRKTSLDTLMVTHIDSVHKMKLLRRQLESAALGICMSRRTMTDLLAAGLRRDKLCVVHPAHDGHIKPRPLRVGITCRTYADGRKREYFLEELCRRIGPADFRFWIMGRGWGTVVSAIRKLGFRVDYDEEFDSRRYESAIPDLDYFLYFGADEGSMGFVDALAAGVKTIVTSVGYQADLVEHITHPIAGVEDLVAAFTAIASERSRLTAPVAGWTWENYARKHLRIWEYLMSGRSGEYWSRYAREFPDGLASLNTEDSPRLKQRVRFLGRIVKNSLRQRWQRRIRRGSSAHEKKP